MFIGRKPDGSIYGTWSCPQPKDADHLGIEEVDDDHPDLVAFLAAYDVKVESGKAKAAALQALQLEQLMVRAKDADAPLAIQEYAAAVLQEASP